MLNILINSYTCCPNMGSEPGMGWNWITNLARYCEVHVISEGEYRPEVEAWLDDNANDEKYGIVVQNLHFYWNPVTPEIRKMCWNQGDWRFYKYYEEWQRKTADIASQICQETKIDILHQLNMIGFREPGYLWKVSKETDIPFVWGPVDAKDKFPMAYTEGASIKTKVFLFVKNIISCLQLAFSQRVKNAARQASVLLAASSNSVRSFNKYMNVDSVLMNETGCCVVKECRVVQSKDEEPLNLLWVGKMDFRKQLALALRSIAGCTMKNVILHIVGGGDAEPYKQLTEDLNIPDNVVFHGVINHADVQQIMQKSDLLLFTSVAEGTPHVVLESIANGLPVVCFDTCGHGDSVNNKVGRKIPLSTPSQSVRDFAEAIDYFAEHREELRQLSANCYERACELSWDNKARQVIALYEKALNK